MRRTDYLFLRPGSRNWQLKLQSPTGRVERSLGTADRVQAEILALPMIAEHKVKLLEARPRLETIWKHDYEPDREHIGPDGDRVIAADRELIHLDSEGRITRRSPNGGPAHHLVGRQKLTSVLSPKPSPEFARADKSALRTTPSLRRTSNMRISPAIASAKREQCGHCISNSRIANR